MLPRVHPVQVESPTHACAQDRRDPVRIMRQRRTPKRAGMMAPLRASFWAALCAPWLTGCSDLPPASYIEYTRILGMRAKVVASPLRDINPQTSRPLAEALPLETVTLQEWIVSPDGPLDAGQLNGRWIACEKLPQTGPGDCLRGYIREEDPILQTGGLDRCNAAIWQLPPSDIPTRNPPCIIAPDRDPPSFTIPLSANLLLGSSYEFWYIASTREGPGTSTCISDLFSGAYELDDECLYGVTDVDIGPQDLMLDILASLGIDPGGLPPTDPDNPPTEGNRHPRISVITYTIEREEVPISPTRILEPDTILEAPLGTTIRFDIGLPVSELQAYPVPVNDGEGIVLRTEEYLNSWFYTWGSLEPAEDSQDLAVERWVLSADPEQEQPEAAPGEIVYAYFAVRDDRGGMDWRTFPVRLLAPLDPPPSGQDPSPAESAPSASQGESASGGNSQSDAQLRP